MNGEQQGPWMESYVRKVLIAVVIALLIALLVVLVWRGLNVLLLIFAGALFGVVLRWLRDFTSRKTGLPRRLALAVVLLGLLILLVGLVALMGPVVKRQLVALAEDLPQSVKAIQDYLRQFSLGEELLQETRSAKQLLGLEKENGDSSVFTGLMGIFSTTLGAIAAVVLIVVIGIYLAVEPSFYINGILRIFPKARRARVLEVMKALGHTVRWWLVGQGLSMLILGTVTTVGLWLLGVPLALVLGLFAAVMTFIPNLGPVIAAVPALLLALAESPMKALYVGVLYVVVQSIEGYFVTPTIHRKVIAMPPALIISVQILLATLVGFLGVLLAMPLVACGLVLIRMLYVEDVLGDSLDRPPV